MNTRREAREWVMQVLYAREISGDPLKQIRAQWQPRNARLPLYNFALDVAQKTDERHDQLDKIIIEYADKWELERIAILDRIILRMAICEILHFDDIPPKVTINEAIEIAKKYSTEKSDKFINGILDAVLHRHDSEGEPKSKSKVIKEKQGKKTASRGG
ncbi:transcription antitermination factor NusB [candidate division LCP-89 bacterium B3_LCP]|uniref:Transcription antitermination protein NusB n=1 Tax=candidate division LCP-89 bacterium B3_LCP TaxID=2012998 RepID=A0A532V2V0_UNCL8|nr:MAG: transcription antitermination factor NusB [candidate division LCP-89 bacterium B3_LCP]